MRLLVTRPEPDALKLRAALEARGYEATVEPLLSVSFEAGEDFDLDGMQALIAPSRYALRALRAHPLRAAARKLPLFAVGPATAAGGPAPGFSTGGAGGGTGQGALPPALSVADTAAGLLLYLAGATVAGDLEGDLELHGFRVLQRVVYRMRPARALGEETIEQLVAGEIDGVILMSPRTATLYASLMRKHGLSSVARRLIHFCLSSQIPQRLNPLGEAPIEVAETPRLEEVLALIDAAAARSNS